MIKNKNIIIKGKVASGKTTFALDLINQKPDGVHIFVYDELGVYNNADVIRQEENDNIEKFIRRVIDIVRESVPRNHTSIIIIDHAEELDSANLEEISNLQALIYKLNRYDIFLCLLTLGVIFGHDLNCESFKYGMITSDIFKNFDIIEPYKSELFCPKCGSNLVYQKINGSKVEYKVICKNFQCTGFFVNATFNNLWTMDSEFNNYLDRRLEELR